MSPFVCYRLALVPPGTSPCISHLENDPHLGIEGLGWTGCVALKRCFCTSCSMYMLEGCLTGHATQPGVRLDLHVHHPLSLDTQVYSFLSGTLNLKIFNHIKWQWYMYFKWNPSSCYKNWIS